MAANKYADLLNNPLWQRRRLEVFNRDNFTCVRCGSGTIQLHVHHKFYDGRNPWEYELSALETLCKLCHVKQHPNQVMNSEARIEIENLKMTITKLRGMVANSWYPATEIIETRLNAATELLNQLLNNEDRG